MPSRVPPDSVSRPPEGLGRRPRLRGKVRGLGRLQVCPQPFEARRVLAHEQLRREVESVERAGEGPELGLVELEPHHLADADLHAVKAHRPVLFQVGEHEALRQRERWLGLGVLGVSWAGAP